MRSMGIFLSLHVFNFFNFSIFQRTKSHRAYVFNERSQSEREQRTKQHIASYIFNVNDYVDIRGTSTLSRDYRTLVSQIIGSEYRLHPVFEYN